MSARPAPKRAARSEAAPARPPLGVVPRSQRWLRRTTALLSLLALMLLFGLVVLNALIVRNQGALDDLDREISEAQRTNQLLRFEIAELEAPERIRALAMGSLGMVEPEVVIYLEPISRAQLGDS